MGGVRFGHVNVIATDWRRLAAFYTEVFGCEFVPPERDISGPVLEAATGARVAFMIRFGNGLLPEPKTVIQASDQVYIAAVSGRIAEALAIAALPPGEDVG